MKIQNPFRLGLLGGLGVLVADRHRRDRRLARHRPHLRGCGALPRARPRPAGDLAREAQVPATARDRHASWSGCSAVFAGLVFAIIPVISEQVGNAVMPCRGWSRASRRHGARTCSATFPWITVDDLLRASSDWSRTLDRHEHRRRRPPRRYRHRDRRHRRDHRADSHALLRRRRSTASSAASTSWCPRRAARRSSISPSRSARRSVAS